MTIGMAILISFLVLCVIGAVVAALYGLMILLENHPVILGVLLFLLLWTFAVVMIYVRG